VYDPPAGQMLGTYGGFFYDDTISNEAACSPDQRGGAYFVNRDGGVSNGPLPDAVVGNPALTGGNLQWKNPFEVAVNATSGKAYVTDRCWNDFEDGGQAGGGAVLVISESQGGTPTPQPTTGPTTTPTATPTPQSINLVFSGPPAVAQNQSFSVTVRALNVGGTGLYGAQLEVAYNPALISVGSVQVNSNFPFVVVNNVDNVAGKFTVVASRQGAVPGLTGNVNLLTFNATAANSPGTATFSFAQAKIGNPQAVAFAVTTQNYTVTIGAAGTPTPGTPTATPVTTTPTPTSTTPQPTATPGTPTTTPVVTATPTATSTVAPGTPTTTPTPTPLITSTPMVTSTTTPQPTATPGTPTSTPVVTPTSTVTSTATPTPLPPTPTPGTPTVTPGTPTATPTAGTPTATPTPGGPTATPGPTSATVSGQVILAGQSVNDWSGAVVTIDDTAQSAVTNATGNFSITNVATGTHTSITADADGYLSAVCTSPVVTAPQTNLLAITLLSGDINGDDVVDVADATAIGVSFGATGPNLPADLNRDELVDIFDIILVGVNFGKSGPQSWVCQ
jgi:hypothetical protein